MLKYVTNGKVGKCKTKINLADLNIFTHISTFLGIFRCIQAYLGVIRHIQELYRYIEAYLEPGVTLAFPEPWRIQNPRHIQNPDIF